MIRPNELALAGFPTIYNKDAQRAIWVYNLQGKKETKSAALQITVSEKGFKCGVKGCGCAFVNTEKYSLPRLALLLRGLKHDYYATLIETYLEEAAEAAALADIEGEDG